jgi:hypothetical protein
MLAKVARLSHSRQAVGAVVVAQVAVLVKLNRFCLLLIKILQHLKYKLNKNSFILKWLFG